MSSGGRLFEERALLIFIVLIALLLLDPLVPSSVSNIPFAIIGVAGAWLLTERKSLYRRAMLIMACGVLALFAAVRLLPLHSLETVRTPIGVLLLILSLSLYASCAGLILTTMLKAREVRRHQILSSVNLYLILGVFWAHVYTILDWFHPAAFGLDVPHGESASHFIYFSFVTLASLGYGDITPKTELAQRLAILEAIMGQFYGAIVVAYLLSVYIGGRTFEKGDSSNRKDTLDK